jgi:hypothetical protein
MRLQTKEGIFFSIMNIYNNLMKMQQGLINKNNSKQIKILSYFICS